MREVTVKDQPSAQGYILLHVFLGPVLPTLGMLAWTLITSAPHAQSPFQFDPEAMVGVALVLAGVLLTAWFFGLVPAILYAVSMLVLHRLMGRTVTWLLLTPLVGWLVTWLPLLLIAGTDSRAFTEGAPMALVGSAAAVGCLLIAWARRIYPVRAPGEVSSLVHPKER